MRIDKFLKNSRIIKRRPVAKEACEGGRVSINGSTAKPGDKVKIGDEVTVRFGTGDLKIIVKDLIKNPRKNEAAEMYEQVN